jgi:hypothetical protein
VDAYDSGYAFGQLFMGLLIPLVVLAGIVFGVIAIVRASSKPAPVPTADVFYFAKFATRPGERLGSVWWGVHRSGARLIVTITSMGDLVMNYYEQEGAPVRVRQATSTVTLGPMVAVNGPTMSGMVEVTLSSTEHPPFVVYLEPAAAETVARWAAHRS